jgi:hypothetical protein
MSQYAQLLEGNPQSVELTQVREYAQLLQNIQSAELVQVVIVNQSLGSLNWNLLTTSSNVSFNNGYVCNNNLVRIVVTLPSTNGSNGDVIAFRNLGIAGFRIQQNNITQQITAGNKKTTIGLTGAIESFDIGDYLKLERILGEWVVVELTGNINIL